MERPSSVSGRRPHHDRSKRRVASSCLLGCRARRRARTRAARPRGSRGGRPPRARGRRRRRARPRRGRVAAVVDDAASAEASDS
eukprot:29980-Pelagococcus_subviridis.AAC.6